MPRGNPGAVSLGPGYLFAAIVGSTEPTDLSTAWPAAWVPLGYTEEGSASSYALEGESVTVAEELDELDWVTTGRAVSVNFSLAENTASNYKKALNGGTITVTGSAPNQIYKFEPPDLGSEIFTAIGFQSEKSDERIVWRQCKQVGSIETARRKGASKALIPCEFKVFKPASGAKSYMRLSNRPGETAT